MNAADPAPLTPRQRADLEAALRARQRELRADVAAKLKTPDDQRHGGLRNRMEDTDDGAAGVSRDLAELAIVEQGLARIADGSYGECVDCASPIPYGRLAAYPAAKRCVACQESVERRERGRK